MIGMIFQILFTFACWAGMLIAALQENYGRALFFLGVLGFDALNDIRREMTR